MCWECNNNKRSPKDRLFRKKKDDEPDNYEKYQDKKAVGKKSDKKAMKFYGSL